jgi:hypothetical protein
MMKHLIFLLLIAPSIGFSAEICQKVNNADLDPMRYGFDQAEYALFEGVFLDYANLVQGAQFHGIDGIYDSAIEELARELEEIIRKDEAKPVPTNHNRFMMQYNEFTHKQIRIMSLVSDELANRYSNLLVKKTTQYAKIHQKKLKSTSCSIEESIRALETLKTLKATVEHYSPGSHEADIAFVGLFKKSAVDFINRCPLKGVVKAEMPYPQTLCPSSSNKYFILEPHFYAWDLAGNVDAEYSTRIQCNAMNQGMNMQFFSFVRNQSRARLELDDQYKLFLRTHLAIKPAVDAYTFICQKPMVPNKALSRGQLNSLAKSLSQEETDCVVQVLNQGTQGGSVSITSEGQVAGEFRGDPEGAGPPYIQFNPPTGEQPVFEGSIGMKTELPEVEIDWVCTQPYKVKSMDFGTPTNGVGITADLSKSKLSIEFIQ